MKRIAKKTIVILLAALLCFCGTCAGAEGSTSMESAYFDMVLSSLINNFKFEADTEAMVRKIADKVLAEHPELLEDLVNIASDQLDQHTDYYTPEEMDAFTNVFKSQYVGIGVTVQRMVGSVGIVSVVAGSPAESVGLMPGDRILKVNGVDVTDFSVQELTPLIQGVAGTSLTLTILRDTQELTMALTRAAVAANTVGATVLEGGIGYLKIASFSTTTPVEIGAADAYFRTQGITRLIVDVRDNPGGEMISVVNSLGYFVPQGKNVVSIEYAEESRNTTLRSVGHLKDGPYYKDLVVLVNENSASGAELFAGNIRDHQLGTLVGVTTVGKGTMQEFLSLPPLGEQSFGSVKITTAEYVLPGGDHINGVGIRPEDWEANRTIKGLDTSQMEPVDYFSDYQEGDSGPGVLALKQRFDALGYFVGELNEQFDHELSLSVQQFQKLTGMSVTGVVNYDTLRMLNNYLDNVSVLVDEQMNRAIEILSAK